MTSSDDKWDSGVSSEAARRNQLFEQAMALQEALERELVQSSEALEAYDDARTRRELFKAFAWARRLKQLSQIDVAKMMKTSQSAVSDIEKGLKDPRLTTLQRLARALGFELRIHLATGPWVIAVAWRARDLAYGSSVQPMRGFLDDKDTLMVLVHEEHARRNRENPPERGMKVERETIMPMAVRNDRLVGKREVEQLRLTHQTRSAALPSR
jgi:transcriptional regulator with XRE-family HTH domain